MYISVAVLHSDIGDALKRLSEDRTGGAGVVTPTQPEEEEYLFLLIIKGLYLRTVWAEGAGGSACVRGKQAQRR